MINYEDLYLHVITLCSLDVTVNFFGQMISSPPPLEKMAHTPFMVIGLPEEGLVDRTSAYFDLTRDKSVFCSYEFSPTCVSSLYLDDSVLIQEYCKFRLHLGAVMPNAYLLTDKLMLLVNITELHYCLAVVATNACWYLAVAVLRVFAV